MNSAWIFAFLVGCSSLPLAPKVHWPNSESQTSGLRRIRRFDPYGQMFGAYIRHQRNFQKCLKMGCSVRACTYTGGCDQNQEIFHPPLDSSKLWKFESTFG